MKKKPSQRKLLELIEKYYGVKTDIAKACNVSRQSVHTWIENDPVLKEACTEGRGNIMDLAEGAFVELIKKGSERSVLFALERLGKQSGYAQRIETTNKNKLEDMLADLSDDELIEILERNNERINNGR